MVEMSAEFLHRCRTYLEAVAENKRLYNERTVAARIADDTQHGAGQHILEFIRRNPQSFAPEVKDGAP